MESGMKVVKQPNRPLPWRWIQRRNQKCSGSEWYRVWCSWARVHSAGSRQQSNFAHSLQPPERRSRACCHLCKWHRCDSNIDLLCCNSVQRPPEMWVRTTHNSYLSVLQMASVLGLAQFRALPFVHSIIGCDTTSYPFFTGKKVWLSTSLQRQRGGYPSSWRC